MTLIITLLTIGLEQLLAVEEQPQMDEKRNIARKIAVHGVATAHRLSFFSGVEITFKESVNIPGNPNMHHLSSLLKKKGYQVVNGKPVTGATPFLRLCVFKQEMEVKSDEMIAVLGEDQEIDLSQVNKTPEQPS